MNLTSAVPMTETTIIMIPALTSRLVHTKIKFLRVPDGAHLGIAARTRGPRGRTSLPDHTSPRNEDSLVRRGRCHSPKTELPRRPTTPNHPPKTPPDIALPLRLPALSHGLAQLGIQLVLLGDRFPPANRAHAPPRLPGRALKALYIAAPVTWLGIYWLAGCWYVICRRVGVLWRLGRVLGGSLDGLAPLLASWDELLAGDDGVAAGLGA